VIKLWAVVGELSDVLCDKKMPTKLKVLIYKIAIRPTLLYGNETWPITKSLADKICHHVRCACCDTV